MDANMDDENMFERRIKSLENKFKALGVLYMLGGILCFLAMFMQPSGGVAALLLVLGSCVLGFGVWLYSTPKKRTAQRRKQETKIEQSLFETWPHVCGAWLLRRLKKKKKKKI